MKLCSKCKSEEAPPKYAYCRACRTQAHYEWRQKNPERWSQLQKQYRAKRLKNPEWVKKNRKRGVDYWQKLRSEVMDAYGGKRCACCGETEPKFLTIDHVFNDGAKHRRQIGYGDGNGKGASSRTLAWIKKHNFPGGFQVLCMNCNLGKQRNGGTCPHKSTGDNRVKSGEAQTG